MKLEITSNKYLNVSYNDCKMLDAILFVLLLETKYYDNNSIFSNDGKSTDSVVLTDISLIRDKIKNHQEIFRMFINTYPFNAYLKRYNNTIIMKNNIEKFYNYYKNNPIKLNKYLYKLKSLDFIQFYIESFDKKFKIEFKDNLKVFILSGLNFETIYKATIWNNFVKYIVPPLTLMIGFATLWFKLHNNE